MRIIGRAIDWITQSAGRSFTIIFVLAFVIRVVQLSRIPATYVAPDPDWELNAIAISLLENGEFGNPYLIPTGPTAHLPPVYPATISLLYRAFGLTLTGGYARLLFVALSGSLLYALLPWFAGRLGLDRQAGFLGGVAGALLVEWPGHGEYMTAIVMGLLLVAFLQHWRGQRYTRGRSLLLGLAIGTAFHLQPALLTVFGGCLLFELWWLRDGRTRTYPCILVLGIVLACIPWGWRNYNAFGTVFFVRSNLGLELRMGNHPGAAASMAVMDVQGEYPHPRTHFAEARRVRQLGEIAYMQQALADALAWIAGNPAAFLHLTLLRVAHVWLGPLYDPWVAAGTSALTLIALLGVWHALPTLTVPERATLLIPLATYPLIYYVVAYMPRYRVPIDWLLFSAAGAALWHILKPEPQRGRRSAFPRKG